MSTLHTAHTHRERPHASHELSRGVRSVDFSSRPSSWSRTSEGRSTRLSYRRLCNARWTVCPRPIKLRTHREQVELLSFPQCHELRAARISSVCSAGIHTTVSYGIPHLSDNNPSPSPGLNRSRTDSLSTSPQYTVSCSDIGTLFLRDIHRPTEVQHDRRHPIHFILAHVPLESAVRAV